MKRNFNLTTTAAELGLSPDLEKVLEIARPLTEEDIIKCDKHLPLLLDLQRFVEGAPQSASLAYVCETLAESEMFNPWASAVLSGVATLIYKGTINAQRAYRVLCMAAGSALRRPESEPFRVVLSFLTKIGVYVAEGDDSGIAQFHHVTVDPDYFDKAQVFLGMCRHVKGAEITAALCAGLGASVGSGALSVDDAIPTELYTGGYRASSPLLQLMTDR